MVKPLCFVLMPFGRKTDSSGRATDFDEVYRSIIAPSVEAADMQVIRADEEHIGGSIHKPMFERLMMCDYAVADVTGANPNVYYELGIRHAVRPRATVILFAEGTSLPFDLAPLRGIPYRIDSTGRPVDAGTHVGTITQRLVAARQDPHDDSPLFQLVDGMPRMEIDHSKTDIFRERVDYSKKYKDKLALARQQGEEAVRQVAADPAFGNLLDVETGIVVDLFLSFREVKSYAAMIELYARLPLPLQRARLMREQYAFALNREGRGSEAEKVLKEVLTEYGPSSETNALLGRIYKDRWDVAKKEGRNIEARGLLRQAIDAYLGGFQADWRDAYPGINAVTLMEMLDKPDPTQKDILPVVRYAVMQKAKGSADYWDHATLMELAVLGRDQAEAEEKTADALAAVMAGWQLETTARNLRLIRELRLKRGEDAAWIKELEDALLQKSAQMGTAEKAT